MSNMSNMSDPNISIPLGALKKQPRNSKIINEHAFRSFSKIADFVSQLAEVYGERFHEVALYNHLLTKTKVSNKQAIARNIGLFSEFASRNQDAILTKDPTKIVYHRIAYSEIVFIDLYTILNLKDIDEDTANSIWTHLLVIQATIDPTSEAREVLKKLKDNSSSEGQFLDGFLSKLEGSIDKSQIGGDPLSAATSILKSGVLNDLVGSIDSGVKSGNLDLGKLVGTVQQMLGGLSGQMGGGDGAPGNFDLGGLMSSMTAMMGSSNNTSAGSTPGNIDLGGMMGAMSAMMGAGASNNSPAGALAGLFGGQGGGGLSGLDPEKMKAKIEAEVEAEKKKMEDEEKNALTKL